MQHAFFPSWTDPVIFYSINIALNSNIQSPFLDSSNLLIAIPCKIKKKVKSHSSKIKIRILNYPYKKEDSRHNEEILDQSKIETQHGKFQIDVWYQKA